MRLARIRSNFDPFHFCFGDLLTEQQLSRLRVAVRHAPTNQQNEVLDEGFIKDMLKGGLVKARGAMSGIPPEIKADKYIKQLLALAEKSNVNLLDPKMKAWWDMLGQYFDNVYFKKYAKDQNINLASFLAAVKKRIEPEILAWTKYVGQDKETQDLAKAEREDEAKFQEKYAKKKKKLQRQHKMDKLKRKYGQDDREQIADLKKRLGKSKRIAGHDYRMKQVRKILGAIRDKGESVDVDAVEKILDVLERKHAKALADSLIRLRHINEQDAREFVGALEEGLGRFLQKAWGGVWGTLKAPFKAAKATWSGAKAGKDALRTAWRKGDIQGGIGGLAALTSHAKREGIAANFLQKSVNKTVASLTIKAALDVAKDLVSGELTLQSGKGGDQDENAEMTATLKKKKKEWKDKPPGEEPSDENEPAAPTADDVELSS